MSEIKKITRFGIVNRWVGGAPGKVMAITDNRDRTDQFELTGKTINLALATWEALDQNPKSWKRAFPDIIVDKPVPVSYDYSLAEKSAASGYPSSQAFLEREYSLGEHVPVDWDKAFKWVQKLANGRSPYAGWGALRLGYMYRQGKGVTKDDTKAAKWYRKAAEEGNTDGMVNLGYMYRRGEGVSKDDAKAVTWIKKAAEAGNSGGMFNVGAMYYDGKGVEKDDTEAEHWLKKAFDTGDPWAANDLAYHWAEEGKNLDQAEAMIKTSLEKLSKFSYPWDTLGWVYFKQGKYDKAVEALRKSLKIEQDAVVLNHLADVYTTMGKTDEADRCRQQANALNKEK